MASEVKLQALKENVDTVEVNAVKVAVGDDVEKGQGLLEVQADKATLDVPSPVAGRIAKLLVQAGDQLKIGQAYAEVEESANGEAKPAAQRKQEAPPLAASPPAAEESKPAAKEPPAEEPKGAAKPQAEAVKPQAEAAKPQAEAGKVVLAGPATRKLARELGVDLANVVGSGPGGRVTQDDVKDWVKHLASAPTPAGPGVQAPTLPKFEQWGPVEAQRLDPIRKVTAKQMALAWSLIPHVTQHDVADITDLESFRKSQDGKGPKLTVTAFALKACAIALKEYPHFNASLDLAGGQLILKKHYHLGVAVDTGHGLLVPVLRDVDKKSVAQLAAELIDTAERGRQKKLTSDELKGGTFTITNLGGIGGTGFTPIINWPEVAILGLSRGRLTPVAREGAIVPRLLLPLSLSYDHRVIDGADAARFTRRIAEMLENPLQMLLHA